VRGARCSTRPVRSERRCASATRAGPAPPVDRQSPASVVLQYPHHRHDVGDLLGTHLGSRGPRARGPRRAAHRHVAERRPFAERLQSEGSTSQSAGLLVKPNVHLARSASLASRGTRGRRGHSAVTAPCAATAVGAAGWLAARGDGNRKLIASQINVRRTTLTSRRDQSQQKLLVIPQSVPDATRTSGLQRVFSLRGTSRITRREPFPARMALRRQLAGTRRSGHD